MDSQLLTPLSTLETRLNNLLMSMVSSPTAAGAPAAALVLLEADDALSSALETLHTHQSNYAKILRLRAEALSLEERVRDIVREVENVGNEISTACQQGMDVSDDDSSDSESEIEAEGGSADLDTHMGGVSERSPRFDPKETGKGKRKLKNEIDYKLLVDFARRISRYNSDAAADVGAGSPLRATPPTGDAGGQPQQVGVKEENGKTVERVGTGRQPVAKGVGVAALSQETVSWLDETAKWSRDLSRMPFPSEDRIRMGLMGQLQTKASEGVDVEKEIERLIRVSEGEGAGTGAGPGGAQDSAGAGEHATAMDEVVGIRGEHIARGSIGRSDTAMGGVPVTGAKPKAVLDLDLYDPDEDD
ncbi:hypothetical protein AJ78_01791 [Emergomyces pasteurianus Ep9510]|uniref:Mediator of RNA polymerase II transcription subunit 4 n=1 Tax=Emergomyces pasteurianus Ep9510 TaxID=1447872 RepID=A0A1J9PQK2_9EURO|nr:hypothetical protein AJ78_01791 [Emergomyces pasteurianus Ep9510]